MSLPVKLSEVVDEMGMQSDGVTIYLDKRTGEFMPITEDDLAAIENEDPDDEPEWQREELPKIQEVLDSEDWIALPDQHEMNEWEIMEGFCLSLEDEARRNELLEAIHGRGAFRFFKQTVRRMEIEKDWYRFRDEAFKEIAVEWLNENEIPFTGDYT